MSEYYLSLKYSEKFDLIISATYNWNLIKYD